MDIDPGVDEGPVTPTTPALPAQDPPSSVPPVQDTSSQAQQTGAPNVPLPPPGGTPPTGGYMGVPNPIEMIEMMLPGSSGTAPQAPPPPVLPTQALSPEDQWLLDLGVGAPHFYP